VVRENLERVRERIGEAVRAAGRDPAGIRLIGVTKGVSVERIREAMVCGIREIGENRVQEAAEKQSALGAGYPEHSVPGPRLTWHLIGHLQRNKVKFAVELFDAIHSVDSVALVQALDRQARRKLELLIQVNLSGETAKHGCAPEEVDRLAEGILKTEHLKLTGLMTLAPFSENPEDSRPFFRKLRELRDGLLGCQIPVLDLSMGMSRDFEVAIQEGATLVRVGTAIFGERTP
jgi:PLP dependent protein